MHILLLWCVSVSVMSTVQIIFTKKQTFLHVKSKKFVDETYTTKRYLNEIFTLFRMSRGKAKKQTSLSGPRQCLMKLEKSLCCQHLKTREYRWHTDITTYISISTQELRHYPSLKSFLLSSFIISIVFSHQAIKVTPIVWIFLAIISVLVLMIVLIGLILRARCSKSSRHKAKFVRATEQQSTLLKENGLQNTRGNNPDLIPDPGVTSSWQYLILATKWCLLF